MLDLKLVEINKFDLHESMTSVLENTISKLDPILLDYFKQGKLYLTGGFVTAILNGADPLTDPQWSHGDIDLGVHAYNDYLALYNALADKRIVSKEGKNYVISPNVKVTNPNFNNASAKNNYANNVFYLKNDKLNRHINVINTCFPVNVYNKNANSICATHEDYLSTFDLVNCAIAYTCDSLIFSRLTYISSDMGLGSRGGYNYLLKKVSPLDEALYFNAENFNTNSLERANKYIQRGLNLTEGNMRHFLAGLKKANQLDTTALEVDDQIKKRYLHEISYELNNYIYSLKSKLIKDINKVNDELDSPF